MDATVDHLARARAHLEAGRPGAARDAAARVLEDSKAEPALIAEALDLAVDAAEALGDLPGAITLQKRLIAHVGASQTPRDNGIDYERLGDLLLHRCWELEDEEGCILGPRPVREADEAYAAAHECYAAAEGPGSPNVVEAIYGRLQVAAAGKDGATMLEHARALLETTAGPLRGGKRGKKKIAKVLSEAAAVCEERRLIQPANALSRKAGELLGTPPTSYDIVLEEGPPRLAHRYPKWPTTVTEKGQPGDAFSLEVPLFNRGGEAHGIEISCHGPAIELGLVGGLTASIDRPKARASDVRMRPTAPDRVSGRSKIALGSAVANAEDLRALGSVRLGDAEAKSECDVRVTGSMVAAGSAEMICSVKPQGTSDERGVHLEVRVEIRPRREPKARKPRRAATKSEKTMPAAWVERAERLMSWLERAQSDVELRLDLSARIASLPAIAGRYVELVAREGPLPDDEACKRLQIDATELEAGLASVDAFVSGLESEAESEPSDPPWP